ncbi:hypothetical protein CASFOL_025795 [Castilleja foliolosa]|uniref:B box-type domain-containing protein n=1 Tax=Castilleja foliolosa TaxID=1961234 RepID=A0ABD3CS49_9LAMI
MKSRHCELCNAAAAVYCPSDAAFLCRSCDAKVHDANFLVARHVRQSVCSNCKNFTGQEFAGVGSQPHRAICNSCSPCSDEDEDGVISFGYSSCSSDCISSTTSPAKEYSGGRSSQGSDSSSNKKRQRGGQSSRRVEFLKAEGIFVDWCGKLGVGADVAVEMACRGLSACSESWTVLPFRVCLAASMWLGLRLSGDKSVSTWQVLKRLEEISGVPAKIILAAELKLARGFRGGWRLRRRRLELEEGWAEC